MREELISLFNAVEGGKLQEVQNIINIIKICDNPTLFLTGITKKEIEQLAGQSYETVSNDSLPVTAYTLALINHHIDIAIYLLQVSQWQFATQSYAQLTL